MRTLNRHFIEFFCVVCDQFFWQPNGLFTKYKKQIVFVNNRNITLFCGTGQKDAAADFLVQLIQSEKIVNEQFNTLDPKFIELLQGFTEGLNAFATKHPDEILESSLFPVTPQKLLRYTQLQLFISNGAIALTKIPIIIDVLS